VTAAILRALAAWSEPLGIPTLAALLRLAEAVHL
jgi:hypothetical protein